MQLGSVGLGRMGGNIVRRLMRRSRMGSDKLLSAMRHGFGGHLEPKTTG
jgi:6-phosphogluconate dehydrogenase (decarboxylating)